VDGRTNLGDECFKVRAVDLSSALELDGLDNHPSLPARMTAAVEINAPKATENKLTADYGIESVWPSGLSCAGTGICAIGRRQFKN
jgi:hypothetical protein